MEKLLLALLQQHSPASKFSSQISWPNGSLCFDKIGVDAKKAFLLWTPQPPGAACLMSAAELPSLNQKMFRRKKEEEKEKEEESRGISKAFSFVKNRRLPSFKAAFHETSSSPANFVYPLFIHEGRMTHLSGQCRDV
ncbi:hypothetical protein ACFX2K_028337 [Malus domestica]